MSTLLLVLAPAVFYMTWLLFMTSKNLVVSLVTLLATSIILPLIYMQYFKMFWPCGLIIILMSTGLIVIFAYIVSLFSSEEWQGSKPSFIIMMLSATLLVVASTHTTTSLHYSSNHPYIMQINVEPLLSLLLILLLLYMVVSFIRNVYSKGGGFRKKF